MGVVGVRAESGVDGTAEADLPFIRESHFLVVGVMEIRASENF